MPLNRTLPQSPEPTPTPGPPGITVDPGNLLAEFLAQLLAGLRQVAADAIQQASDAFRPMLADVGTGIITGALPAALGRGLLAFVGLLGHWLYDVAGAVLRDINIVTQRPEAWTNRLDLVVQAWGAMRLLATVLVLVLAAVSFLEWTHRRHRGDALSDLADRFAGLAVAAALVQLSLGAFHLATPALNAILTGIGQTAALSGPDALPGWSQAAAAADDTPEGVGRLVIAIQALLVFVHLAIATGWWDVLILTAPLACASLAWAGSAGWFFRWGTAVLTSALAQAALVLTMQVSGALLARATAQVTTGGSVTGVAVTLVLGFAFCCLVMKVAAQTHAGISILHPFATLHQARSTGRQMAGTGHAARAVLLAPTPAAPVGAVAAGTAAVAGAAGAAGVAGVATGAMSATPVTPPPAMPAMPAVPASVPMP